jgi:hypothetical protein
MQAQALLPTPWGFSGNVQLAHNGVMVAALDKILVAFVEQVGLVHQVLFQIPLVITSGHDGQHAPGSKHYTDKAVDVRMRDKAVAEQVIFLQVLAYLGPRAHMAVFDERAQTGEGHVHIEIAS